MEKPHLIGLTLFLLLNLRLGKSVTFKCVISSALNTDHQFHCCYTDRNPNCQNVCIDNTKVCDGKRCQN